MAETNQNPVVDSMDHCWNFRSTYLTRFRVYFWQFAHRSACVQVIMFTCVDWIAQRGNKSSLFLVIYVSEEPPGMPLQWFLLFFGAGGLENTKEVWQGGSRAEEEWWGWTKQAREEVLNIPLVNNSAGRCFCRSLAAF